jgi:hypothetical protein
VKRLVVGLSLGAGLATISLILALALEPGQKALELDVFVLVVGGMAVLTGVLAVRRAYPLAKRSALADALEDELEPPIRPPDLDRTERVLSMATTAAFDIHFRLRPILREVAEQRLADRRGLRLDSGDAHVREALGVELWELVRPEREQPAERFGQGIEVERLARVVDRLEAL